MTQKAEVGIRSSRGGLPVLQTEFNASLDNLVESCLKINKKRAEKEDQSVVVFV